MKRIAAIALFVAATLATTGIASAQEHTVQATIPFSFTVSHRTMPAGTYTIRSADSSPNILAINDWKDSAGVLAMGMPGQANPDHASKLVFHKYGAQYFLSEIRTANSSLNVHFAVSKEETKARAQTQVAGLPVNDSVLIALNDAK
jgi:hypothetical protein